MCGGLFVRGSDMSKTKRNQPTDREAKWERLEREWERQVEKQVVEPVTLSTPIELMNAAPLQQLPPGVLAIQKEAESLVNKAPSRRPFSVQTPATDLPSEYGGGLVWWTGGTLDSYIPLSEYGQEQRVHDLRMFALMAPLILNAESVLTKKVQSLQWTIEGGRNLAQKWQKRLNNFENGDGWDYFIARWIRAYCESDKPACAEIIRSAPRWAVDDDGQLTPRGEKALEDGKDVSWEIVDSRVMDPASVFPTVSKEFPLIYRNSYTGKRYQLRAYQYMSLTDLPSVDDRHPGMGICAVSRAVWAAQEERMIIRYSMEKMSENPGAGIGIINASTTALQTALNSANAQREARGVVYYKGVIFLPVLDPSGATKMEFLSFSGLPDGFDRTEVYNMIKEVVATSFGLDILELGSIPGRLGTATQAKVAAQKGRTKSIGAIMQGVERAFRYKLLPESISFNIKKHDQDEEYQRAEIDEMYVNNAVRIAQFAPDPRIAMQYLADKGAVPNEPPYIMVDLTGIEEVQDVATPQNESLTAEAQPDVTGSEAIAEGPEGAAEEDIVKRYEPRVRIDREGKVKWLTIPNSSKHTSRRSITKGGAKLRLYEEDEANALSTFERRFPQYAELLRQ